MRRKGERVCVCVLAPEECVSFINTHHMPMPYSPLLSHFFFFQCASPCTCTRLVDVDVVLVLLCVNQVPRRPLLRAAQQHHHVALAVPIHHLLAGLVAHEGQGLRSGVCV
jgi:hypothetical protein